MNNEAIERAALAEKLRHYGRDDLKGGSLLRTLKDVTGGATWRDCLLRLADAVDPRCARTSVGDEWLHGDAEFEPVRTCRAEQDYDCDEPVQGRWWTCDACESRFAYERGFRPRYCPECGARVVNGDGN